MIAIPKLAKVDKTGQVGFSSGMTIILNEAKKAIIEIKKGNNFGPTGSEKNGASN